MIEAPLNSITEDALKQLIREDRSESRRLEFKSELWGGSDGAAKEMLSDITAFANSDGGDLVIGMEEDRHPDRRGIAKELVGIPRTGLEKAIDSIVKRLRDSVDPRLPQCQFHPVELANGKMALVVRVPASFIGPHRVTLGGSTRFAARDSRGKYDMTTDELRRAFLASEDGPAQLRTLHLKAIAATSGENMPTRIAGGPRIVATLAPLSVTRERRDVRFTRDNAVLPPHVSGGVFMPIGLEGLIAHLPIDTKSNATKAWAVNHYRGYIDFAWQIGIDDDHHDKVISEDEIQNVLPGELRFSLSRLKDFGLDGPWVILVTVLGVRGFSLIYPNGRRSNAAWQDGGLIGEIVTDRFSGIELQPMTEAFYRMFGLDIRTGS